MPFKADRFTSSYKRVTQEEVPVNIRKSLEALEHTGSPEKKASAILDVMKQLGKTNGSRTASRIMMDCGTRCIGDSIIRKAKTIYAGSKSMEDFIAGLNAHRIGGGRLVYENGTVTGGYDKCYCGSVSKSRGAIPLEYCSCSAGWYKRLFEEILKKEIQVEVKKSIISGAKTCEFVITV
jgi:predicted hydrocarbon binding protein